jgi:hypothetical protein
VSITGHRKGDAFAFLLNVLRIREEACADRVLSHGSCDIRRPVGAGEVKNACVLANSE